MSSYVAVAKYQCPVCLEMHHYGAPLLFDKRMQPIKEEHLFLGHELCETHATLEDDGYIFLVAIEEPTSEVALDKVIRTGDIVTVRKEVAMDIFGSDFKVGKHSMVFIDTQVFEYIKTLAGEIDEI